MAHPEIKTCREVEPFFAAYVDGEAAPAEAATVQAHVGVCLPCHSRVEKERAARDLVRARARDLCGCAPVELKARCAARARERASVVTLDPSRQRSNVVRRVVVPLSMAAAAVLVVGTTVFMAFGTRVEAALATQMTLDHIKCLSMPKSAMVRGAAPLIQAALHERYGLDVTVPPGCAAERLELVGAKRCLYSDGRMAHLVYEHEGRPLSLYVLFDGGQPDRLFEIMGHEAFIWSVPELTYAMVGRESGETMTRLAHYVRTAAVEGVSACR